MIVTSLIAAICPLLMLGNSIAGVEFSKVWLSSFATLVAASTDEIGGMLQSEGKNLTVSVIWECTVLEQYTL